MFSNDYRLVTFRLLNYKRSINPNPNKQSKNIITTIDLQIISDTSSSAQKKICQNKDLINPHQSATSINLEAA